MFEELGKAVEKIVTFFKNLVERMKALLQTVFKGKKVWYIYRNKKGSELVRFKRSYSLWVKGYKLINVVRIDTKDVRLGGG